MKGTTPHYPRDTDPDIHSSQKSKKTSNQCRLVPVNEMYPFVKYAPDFLPQEVAPQGFHSQVVQRYQRASQTTQRLFARLYLEGLATGDFEPVFRELVGETTALSANTVVRLKEHWSIRSGGSVVSSILVYG